MVKNCMACIKQCWPYKKGHFKSLISDHGTMLASVNPRPNSKAHTVVITKRHVDDLRNLTDQGWADILSCLKESIKKINQVYHPVGYQLNISAGQLAGANQPPYGIVPKYKEDYGQVTNYKSATMEE